MVARRSLRTRAIRCAATVLLRDLARRHGATVGGSFLCRDRDGEARNAFLLSGPDGRILGRHDKDLPTMVENCLYIGGEDDGVIDAGELRVGAALCWEFMRTQTARRLRGQVDVVVGGSLWLSIPPWPPRASMARAGTRSTPVGRRRSTCRRRCTKRSGPSVVSLTSSRGVSGT
jgi:predicted amidohydrolase